MTLLVGPPLSATTGKKKRISPPRRDYAGKVFGRLTVIGPSTERANGKAAWLCRCECGTQAIVGTNLLTSGKTRSCGCLGRETASISISLGVHGRIRPVVADGFRWCSKCGETKLLAEFCKFKNGWRSRCRACLSEDEFEHFGKPENIAKRKARRKRWHQEKRETVKRAAAHPHRKVNKQTQAAIKSGILVRPTACSKCARSGKTEAHHPDYSKPLEVIWLCKPCHLAEHNRRSHEAALLAVENL
jgi:hypothetical protein